MININKSDDMFYRYKMPSINIKLGGTGNGMFTIINNMDEIAKAINTPPEIVYKFISYTLGSAYNEKKKSLTGHHNNLQEIIFDYINNFVICEHCGIPELSYSLNKKSKKNIKLICYCSACGNLNNLRNNNKINDKCIDTIIKYLNSNNEWVVSKGSMVEHKEDDF
jgi:translation initiation factor 5